MMSPSAFRAASSSDQVLYIWVGPLQVHRPLYIVRSKLARNPQLVKIDNILAQSSVFCAGFAERVWLR
jgi:hypothetical protein